ncbi:hypothetical protein [Halorhabdus utahensis]|uniref:hypothetical protein n=1 Tax=Halorhabdus utahensis TaxID=146826 RepID=UPI00019BBB65|nr:hypothetical protein [Halorhabdus utahensis]
MAERPQYATIRVHEEVRDQARVAKARLGIDWTTFLERAADELDPQEETLD